jgi:hypothetical protein
MEKKNGKKKVEGGKKKKEGAPKLEDEALKGKKVGYGIRTITSGQAADPSSIESRPSSRTAWDGVFRKRLVEGQKKRGEKKTQIVFKYAVTKEAMVERRKTTTVRVKKANIVGK